MAFRLAAHLEQGLTRLPLVEGDNIVGSDLACGVHLVHPSVSRRHARLQIDGDLLVLEDLGSANGTLVGSQRVRSRQIVPGDPLYFGRVFAVVEEVPDQDLEEAGEMAAPARRVPPGAPGARRRAPEELAADARAQPAASGSGSSTASLAPLESFTLDHLPGLLAAAAGGASREEMAQKVGAALFTVVPAATVEVVELRDSEEGFLFRSEYTVEGESPSQPLEVGTGSLRLRIRLATPGSRTLWAPLAEAGLWLMLLGGREGRLAAAHREPSSAAAAAIPPDPPTVVPQVRQIYQDAARVARGDVGVLITGESGTGKEVLARFIHAVSARSSAPFVALNCAALPRDLLEAELFGIERGVATGVDSRAGKFELADEGTLFLDEIGDMSPETQASILRVLQEKEVFRLGSARPRPARTRIVAATNRDLSSLLAEGRFREDLFHRVATWVVELPPLRRRRADIANLAAYFLAREAQRHGMAVGGISRAALETLSRYSWPGNIRQLENEMARAVLFLQPGELLDTARLSQAVRQSGGRPTGSGNLAELLGAVERDEILLTLERAGGDVPAACQTLGLSRATLYRRMKALGIERG
jgi:DNA-binding NtrC family response regulator